VTAVNCQQQGVAVCIEQEGASQQLTSQLLVVADGANSTIRQKLGIRAHKQDYEQTAIIANVSFSDAHNNTAYERFTDWGPMALLPLTDDEQGQARAALVWTMSEEQATHWCDVPEEEFLEQLQQRFGHRQGQFIRVGERHRYPLNLIEAAEQVRTSVVVMGNAAHSLHPVAGQGFNLALRDCARLTEVLIAALSRGEAINQLSLLKHYAERQRRDQFQTIRFSDQLTKLFTRYQSAFSVVRNLGVSGLDVLPVVKKKFVKATAGISDGAAIGGLR
jgi:ubiquinone biosynthesis UbiH/UbiF/VisC/COQ6 family hydroxylase